MPALGTDAAMEDRFVRLQRRLEDLHYFEPLAIDAVPLVSAPIRRTGRSSVVSARTVLPGGEISA
jgi:hypothetical protein